MNQQATGYGYGRPASTIEQFCEDHGLGRSHLFQLWKDGKGPRRMKVGRRTLISAESAAEWRARMERDTEAATA